MDKESELYIPPTEAEVVAESQEFYGYRLDLEDHEALQAGSVDINLFRQACQGEFPESIDPTTWCRIENQRNMGSCQGHAQSSVCEMAFHIKTGEVIQFSPLFDYYATQKIDGLQGSDTGSTISGGVKNAKVNGQCLLNEMPYPNPVRYRWNIPQHAYDVAKQYRIGSSLVCKSYDDILQYLGSGQGGVEGGLVWNNSMTPDKDGYIRDCNVSAGGGHALAFLGYTSGQELDPDGNRWIWMANSWDVTWGLKGWAKVSKKVIEKQIHSRQGVFVGMSDLSVPGYRKVDYSLW